MGCCPTGVYAVAFVSWEEQELKNTRIHISSSSCKNMAGNVGVTTRLQSRKIRENLTQENSGGKRKISKGVFSQPDQENVNVASSGVYNRRSFPLEHESDPWQKNSKKAAKTESSAKQRRTLCDRGDNYRSNETVHFTERHHQHNQLPAVAPAKSAKKASRTETWKEKEVYSYHFEADSGNEYSTAMEMESDYCLENARPLIPDHVIDIDANPDSLTTNIYSQDIMEYLMWVEARDRLKPGFLDNSPEVTSRMRGVLMDWLLQVQSHEELKNETLHLCVTLIDSFLSLVEVKMPKLQLIGITCLLIASKINERFAPEISTLCYLTDNTFVKEQVLHCECVILKTLQFNLARPVCTTFLDRYLQVHETPLQVECLASYLLDLSITNVNMVYALPSLKASSALYLARLLLLDIEHAWTPDLVYYTNYTVEELHEWTNDLISLLAKAPDSKFQGARSKYNSENYCYISLCDGLKTGRWTFKKCA